MLWGRGFRDEGLWFRMGDRIRGTLGDADPLNKVPFKRATSRVKKGPVSLVLPRIRMGVLWD